ncbi:hypothetical protein I4U23_015612 [Adineta vaga]|nr:hypothetical protein I4U23_015612 [Adineta vaga]
MTANDPGHINNLDGTQRNVLKECWIELINALHASGKDILNTDYGNELFNWFGCENPDVVLLRWLRAQKWDVKNTVQYMLNLLQWRIKWGVSHFLARGESEISLDEAKVGKGYFMGRDRADRPVCYIHLKEHIRGEYPMESTEKLAVLALEICRKLLRPPVETFTVVLDVNGLSMKNIDLQIAKNFINLFQNYYPESLGLGLIANASWVFNSCWSIVRPWLDPTVENKIKFIKKETDLTKYIDPINIPQRLQGKHLNFQYILPTDEDQKMITTIHNDQQGKLEVETYHRYAATKYLKITLRWAHNDDNQTLNTERSKACSNLANTYEKLLPYMMTQSHYHRTGDIYEPIFDTTYEKLCTSNDDIVYF